MCSQSERCDLLIDWCSHEAAKYACLRWHYARRMPAAPVKIGVWEDDRFVGVVLFAMGSNRYIGAPYGLHRLETSELVRVALCRHQTPVTHILSVGLRMLKGHCPGLRLVVSYADENAGHLGRIYQAGNWLYVGPHPHERGIVIRGRLYHRRTVNSIWGSSSLVWIRHNLDPKARIIRGAPKHKYLMPLDKGMRRRILKMGIVQPYPQEPIGMTGGQGVKGDTPGDQPGEAGSIPAARSLAEKAHEIAETS